MKYFYFIVLFLFISLSAALGFFVLNGSFNNFTLEDLTNSAISSVDLIEEHIPDRFKSRVQSFLQARIPYCEFLNNPDAPINNKTKVPNESVVTIPNSGLNLTTYVLSPHLLCKNVDGTSFAVRASKLSSLAVLYKANSPVSFLSFAGRLEIGLYASPSSSPSKLNLRLEGPDGMVQIQSNNPDVSLFSNKGGFINLTVKSGHVIGQYIKSPKKNLVSYFNVFTNNDSSFSFPSETISLSSPLKMVSITRLGIKILDIDPNAKKGP